MAQAHIVEMKSRTFTSYNGGEYSYDCLHLDGVWEGEVEKSLHEMSRLAATLEDENLDEQFRDSLEELATEFAEKLEVEFVYQRQGKTMTYTPAAFWEASGCEWEESAEYGVDYGWNI